MAQVLYFIGIDLGSKEHQISMVNALGVEVAQMRVTHDREGLLALHAWIASQAPVGPNQISVALESPHGPVVDSFLDRGIQVFAINPRQTDRFRERYKNSGAKDDAFDARVIAWSLRTDVQAFHPICIPPALILELRELTRFQDALKATRAAASNQIQEVLQLRFPSLMSLCGKRVSSPAFLDLCELVPSPDAVRDLDLDALRSVLKRRRIARFDAETAFERLKHAGIPSAPGVIAALGHIVSASCRHLRVLNELVADCDRRIAALVGEVSDDERRLASDSGYSDCEILESCPGCGPYVLSRLLAEAYPLLRSRDLKRLRLYSGVAPVTVASGVQCGRGNARRRRPRIVMRRACNLRLRNAIYHWARVATVNDERLKARYRALRDKGQTHGQALRVLGDRLLAVACALLRDRALYDREHLIRGEEK